MARSIVLSAWLLLVGTAHAQLLSPGDLARVHAKWGSDDDCTRCHSSGRRVEAALCVDCHGDIGRQQASGEGLHGTRFKKDSCGHCHVEHRGTNHKLIRWPGGSQQGFEHGMTGFELEGGHAGLSCKKCHNRGNKRGAKTFLGLDDKCSSCHKDVHQGRLGNKCQDCHTVRAWTGARLDLFDHDKARFALLGKHRKVECAKCHSDPPRYRGLEFASCKSCHEDPHAGRLGNRCSNCHKEEGWDAIAMRRSAHPGLRITGGHARVACRSCHDQGSSHAPSKGSRCVSCHAPVHEARFGNNCQRCHRSIRWLDLPERIGREAHDRTAFALEGMHANVACERCHRTELPVDERFRGLEFARCADCHSDRHNGEFARLQDGECGACHDVHGFQPTSFSVEQHAQMSFSLVGRHVAVPCGSCHPGDAPRLDWHLSNQACADCHDNPHGEQFAKEMRAGGCASCHTPTAWDAPNIDHSTWPLTGAHELLACAGCHDPTEADRRKGTGASYRGVPRRCEGCHSDPHLGQFRLAAPVRECDFCHDTSQYNIERFDHARLAGYPLEGGHAKTKCEDCHPSASLRNGREAVRYRLGYRRCADCHADPHAGGGP